MTVFMDVGSLETRLFQFYYQGVLLQVNEKFFELKKGHIGIVEKAQETSSDSDMHNTVCLCHCSTS